MLQSGLTTFRYAYDATYAENVANASVFPRFNKEIATIATSLRKLVEAKFGAVSAMHTKAHSGHLWNEMADTEEMADTACDQVSRRDMNFAWPPFPAEISDLFAGRPGKIEWLQSLVLDDERMMAYPPRDQ